MSDKLLPCPFCGGEAIRCGNNENNPRHWIMCEDCHACPGGDVPELANAVFAWNRRPPVANVTEAMVNAADSVLSRRRPGIPDETIRLAIAAALDVSDKTPNPCPELQTVVTEVMIEAACAAVLKLRGYDWPASCDEEEQRIARENMTAALSAALAASEGNP